MHKTNDPIEVVQEKLQALNELRKKIRHEVESTKDIPEEIKCACSAVGAMTDTILSEVPNIQDEVILKLLELIVDLNVTTFAIAHDQGYKAGQKQVFQRNDYDPLCEN